MKKIIISTLSVLLAVLAGVRIWYVNATAPGFPVETYGTNQWVELDGCFFENITESTDGYAVRVLQAEFLSFDDYLDKYQLSASLYKENPNPPASIIDVELEYRNDDSDGYFSLLDFTLKAPGDSTAHRVENTLVRLAVPALKDSQFLDFSIRPGTTHTVSFPFYLPAGYEESGRRPLYLTVSNAPIEKRIEVDFFN